MGLAVIVYTSIGISALGNNNTYSVVLISVVKIRHCCIVDSQADSYIFAIWSCKESVLAPTAFPLSTQRLGKVADKCAQRFLRYFFYLFYKCVKIYLYLCTISTRNDGSTMFLIIRNGDGFKCSFLCLVLFKKT